MSDRILRQMYHLNMIIHLQMTTNKNAGQVLLMHLAIWQFVRYHLDLFKNS